MDIRDSINEILEDFAVEFIRNRKDDARKADLVASKDLVRSFKGDVQKATASDLAKAFIAFQGYGRYFDLKRVRRTRQIPIKELEQWIKEVGVSQFIPKFTRKYKLPTSNQRLINQIAWGIAKKKRRHKRRRWYSKNRESDIGRLYRNLLQAYQDQTIQNIKDGATQR
jgi:hypothetical protein